MEKVIDGVRYKKKREPFETFDYRTIERHLAEMASEGWILEKIDGNTWWYRQDEPQKFKYAVTYIDDYSYLKPTDSQLDMDDLCEQAGWKRVAFKDEAHIYCSNLENPVPIETDERTRMETIKKSMRHKLGGYGLVTVLWYINLYTNLKDIIHNPVELLASYMEFFLILIIIFIVILCATEFLYYFRWCRKSEQSIAEGGECWDQEGLYNRQDVAPPVVAAMMLVFFCGEFSTAILIYVCVFMAVILWIEIPKWVLLLKGHWSISPQRGKKIKRSYTAAFLVAAAMLIFTAAMPAESVSEEGRHENGWVYRADSTFMASYEKGYYDSPFIEYEINQVKIDSLYQKLFEKFLKENSDGGYYEEVPAEEAAAWGVDKVLKYYNQYGDRTNFWVIIKDNYFAGIQINERNLTPEVKADILEKMGI